MQVDQIVYITDRTYTREEVLSMEEHILFVLDFELTAPTMKTFLRRFIQAAMAESVPDARLEHLAAYHVVSKPPVALPHSWQPRKCLHARMTEGTDTNRCCVLGTSCCLKFVC